MIDISKCGGNGCPLADTCYRQTKPPHPYLQAYFVTPPFFNNTCEMYIKDETINSGFGDNHKESDQQPA